MRMRAKRRMEALKAAGFVVKADGGEAEAGDTVEITRIIDGRGRGQEGGIMVRATARYVEAYRVGQDSKRWELVPANKLFQRAPDG